MPKSRRGLPRNFTGDPADRIASEVVTYTLTPEELARYGPVVERKTRKTREEASA